MKEGEERMYDYMHCLERDINRVWIGLDGRCYSCQDKPRCTKERERAFDENLKEKLSSSKLLPQTYRPVHKPALHRLETS
jgi:hypothetical protein